MIKSPQSFTSGNSIAGPFDFDFVFAVFVFVADVVVFFFDYVFEVWSFWIEIDPETMADK